MNNLAIYNDKGIHWNRHTRDRMARERARRIKEIETLVARLGVNELPALFLQALERGDISADMTGKYVELLKRHFKRRNYGI